MEVAYAIVDAVRSLVAGSEGTDRNGTRRRRDAFTGIWRGFRRLTAIYADKRRRSPSVLLFDHLGRGHDGVRTLFSRLAEAFDRVQLDVDEYVDAGDAVVMLCRMKVRAGLSGVTTGGPPAQVVRVREGRVVAVRGYLRPEEALEAMGLRE